MTPAAKIAAALAKYGRPMTLARRTVTVTVKGVSKGYAPQDLVAGIHQGDRKITISPVEISAAAWPAPPRDGDLIDAARVIACETRYLGAEVLAYVLQVRGF